MKKAKKKTFTLEKYKQLAKKLSEQGKLDKAKSYYREALNLNPTDIESYNFLGNILNQQNRITEAIECYQQALSLYPNYASAFSNLGFALLKQGSQKEAINAYRAAIQIQPTVTRYQNLLTSLLYADVINPTDIMQEHLKFNDFFPSSNPPAKKIVIADKSPLKIAYISGDFYYHSTTFFMYPILKHHNKEKFHITCYYSNTHEDETTKKLKKYADAWVNCATLTDEQLYQKIKRDDIDILIDLSGHTPLNRLGVLTRSPAPIQMTYLGYPNTTGLRTIDYKIVSKITTPIGDNDKWMSEKAVRLSECHCCFDPLMPPPPISALPAKKNGFITFASFSRLDKLTSATFKLWCEVLHAVPTAKFLFYNSSFTDQEVKKLWLDRFQQAGIDPQRLTFDYLPSISKVFKKYADIDVILDTYPYNGCTTTCQALFMSVPVVTLTGETTVSRVGLDLLHAVDLAHLAPSKAEDFTPSVLSLINDIDSLQRLRENLQQRMIASPLMDGARFTREMEAIYIASLSS